MAPTSIDGTEITGATIDGQDVSEITVDGETVFTAILDAAVWQSLSSSADFWANNPVECLYSQDNDGSGNEIYGSGSTAVDDLMTRYFDETLTSLGTISDTSDEQYTSAAGRRFKFIQESGVYRHYVEEVNENAYQFMSYLATGFNLSTVDDFHYYHYHTTKNGLSGSAIVLREPGTENYEIASMLDSNDLPADGSATDTGPFDVSAINGVRDIVCMFDESTGQNPVESKYSGFYFE